jgi:Toprim-like/Protein of unknown function (DUF3991)
MADQELEYFKSGIDLRTYAAGLGYVWDRKESCRGSTVMRHPAGDKIIIKRDDDGHYVFFSVHSDASGSIIDLVQSRQRLSLGQVRKELRGWSGKVISASPPFPALPKTGKDRIGVENQFARMTDAGRHPYLENERSLPAELLENSRFAGRIRRDSKGNAIFPHFDRDGVCGYEIKNDGFTGFSSGGTKGLWLSQEDAEDTRLVVTESAIDALSHATLFPALKTRYASIGGEMNPLQPELVRQAAVRMPVGSEMVAAMDADSSGRKLADVVRQAVDLSGRTDLRFSIQEPVGFKDWNDQLRNRPNSSFPYRPLEGLWPSIK